MISRISQYWHTIRYLKPQQIYRRLWFRFHRPKPDASPRPPSRIFDSAWKKPARRKPSLIGSETFFFLNQQGNLDELGWDNPDVQKLWRYNQHYFDDLNAEGAKNRTAWHQAVLNRWIEDNPPGVGTGWEPYPTSLRIVNWIKWSLSGHDLTEKGLTSLTIQARWLTQRLEWHILGNHLFSNAKALVFAGLYFDSPEAKRWLDLGLKVIDQQLPEQILADGGHFERSPMYHCLFLEDVLDLINLTEAYPDTVDSHHKNVWCAYARQMLVWLDGMCHPDGEISFFNDASLGVSPAPTEITFYAERLGINFNKPELDSHALCPKNFAESGYLRLEASDAVVLVDVAPIGPDYLPGHAHADTLSFELSLFGSRILVNGGVSQYGAGTIRLQERGTAASNTVEVNGENSSEVWSAFRVAQRASPTGLTIAQSSDEISVTCGHDGYQRLPGRPVPLRTWQLSEKKLLIHDHITGDYKSAVARFHLHPNFQFLHTGNDHWIIGPVRNSKYIHVRVLEGGASVEKSFYAPEFGLRLERSCLAVSSNRSNKMSVAIYWECND